MFGLFLLLSVAMHSSGLQDDDTGFSTFKDKPAAGNCGGDEKKGKCGKENPQAEPYDYDLY